MVTIKSVYGLLEIKSVDGKNAKLFTEKFSSVWFDCVHISLVLNNDIFVAKVSTTTTITTTHSRQVLYIISIYELNQLSRNAATK